jgi:hypothetical protein
MNQERADIVRPFSDLLLWISINCSNPSYFPSSCQDHPLTFMDPGCVANKKHPIMW